MRLISSLVCLGILLVSVPTTAQKRVVLSGSSWRVSLIPQSLFVEANLPQTQRALLLSEAQNLPQPIANLKVTPKSAQWEIPSRFLRVSMRLTGDTLAIDFTAKRAGELVFPRIPAQSAVRGYILPIGEGVYAPTNDTAWREHLVKQEEFSTTEGFYLPLWGLDIGSHTLTYLLTNIFHNGVTFQNDNKGLGLQCTHHFVQREKSKTYGVRIHLGSASLIEPALYYRRWLEQTGQFVSMTEKIRQTPEAAKLLGAPHAYLWGDGVSPEMMRRLKESGFSRFWLGVDGWKSLVENPKTLPKAKEYGYLLAPYDSYHSIHAPNMPPDETWETAQFDQKLYDTGAIVRWDGKKRAGFQKKGYLLSPLVAQPYVEKRVSERMKAQPCNAWFMDCDAFGEVFDDFSPLHPATQADDMEARLKRMRWIRDTYKLVMGSEGGSAYAASTIHYAHGMMTQGFGYGDPDLKNPESPYFLGRYYPPNAPAIFLKQVALKPHYYPFYFDPRFRLPLYQAVFHDSVITTHHWSNPTFKFKEQVRERILLELLYQVPPLYHLNQKEFTLRAEAIKAHYAFFSPLHKGTATLPLRDFRWLSPDHRVQSTLFGHHLEFVANFRSEAYLHEGIDIPAYSILVRQIGKEWKRIFTPAP